MYTAVTLYCIVATVGLRIVLWAVLFPTSFIWPGEGNSYLKLRLFVILLLEMSAVFRV